MSLYGQHHLEEGDGELEARSRTQQWATEYANGRKRPPAESQRPGDTPRRTPRNQRLEEALRARLGPIGHELMFRDHDLFIDGEVIGKHLRRKFVRHQDQRDYLTNDDAFGAVVDRYLPVLVKRRAQRSFVVGKRKLHLARALPELGCDVKVDRAIVGRLTATMFTNADGEHVRGRFWGPGPHWTQAALLLMPADKRPRPAPSLATPCPRDNTDAGPATTALPPPPDREAFSPPRPRQRAQQSSTEPARAPAAARTPTNWPDDSPSDLRAIAAAASEALRDRRVRADDLIVETQCGSRGVVTFWPARFQPPRGRLELPFEVQTSDGAMRGRVYLKSSRTPLSIEVEHRDDAVGLLTTWTLVLQLAAARYCGSPADAESPEPAGFVPDATTRRILRHWVVAHMVRLPAGHQLGIEAAKAADEAGIELPPGCTWRKGHWSGGTEHAAIEGAPLRYTWSPPA